MARLSRPWHFLSIASVLAVVSLLAATVVFNQRTAVGAAPAPTISIVVPHKARVGDRLKAQVIASGVRNVGGFQSTVTFDPAALRVGHVTIAEDLKGSGRDLLALGPVLRPDAVALGAVTCPVAQCTSARYKEKNHNLPGVEGRAVLAEIVFEVTAPGQTELRLDQVQLVDPQGAVLAAATANATVLAAGR